MGATGADLLLIPIARCATPDLADLAGESQQIPRTDGTTSNGSVMQCFNLHAFAFKYLHIPKMVVPTGLTEDGRPSAVQFWGRALEHSQMYDDAAALAHDANFLQL